MLEDELHKRAKPLDERELQLYLEDEGEFTRVTVRVADGIIEKCDGNTLYLQARVRRDEDGVRLAEGTLTVRRPRPGTRFLFFESSIARRDAA